MITEAPEKLFDDSRISFEETVHIFSMKIYSIFLLFSFLFLHIEIPGDDAPLFFFSNVPPSLSTCYLKTIGSGETR